MMKRLTDPRPADDDRSGAPPDLGADERSRSLEDAADAAMLAPSVHGSQPWVVVLHHDRLEVRADRSRQLTALDPHGRELFQSLGAALFNVRVALAARGWAVDVDRFPDQADAEVAAVVRPVPGAPEARLPLLADALHQRRTQLAGFLAEEVPDELLAHLAAAAAAEDSGCVAVLAAESRRLLARLTRQADAAQLRDPACNADLRRWRSQPGEPSATISRRTVDSDTGVDCTYVLITSRADDPVAWLRSGEALERILLELTRLGWAASPMTQALEVPSTRSLLRSSMTGDAHAQVVLRIGFRGPHGRPTHRDRNDVVVHSAQGLPAPSAPRDPRLTRIRQAGPARPDMGTPRPVSDGRGGTTWL